MQETVNKENDLTVQDCEIIIEALEAYKPTEKLKQDLAGLLLAAMKTSQSPVDFEKELDSKSDKIKADFDKRKEDITILRAKVIKIRRVLIS